MDLLEKYKESWKNQPEEANKVSKVDIYKIAHKKSSSIVKWIFMIGIAEFLFWILLTILLKTDGYQKTITAFNIENYIFYYSLLHYILIVVFLILFYKNYKSISVSENTKQLINKIIKTRKIVKYYVNYNLISYIVGSIALYAYFYSDLELFKKVFIKDMVIKDEQFFWTITIIIQILIISIIGLLLWLFYKLIYGKLLTKLNQNRKELSKLDELN